MPTNLAKAGDTVTLSFVTSFPIIGNPTVTFTNIDSTRVNYENTDEDNMTWVVEFDVISSDNDGDISFTVSGKDYAGVIRQFTYLAFEEGEPIFLSSGVTIDTTFPGLERKTAITTPSNNQTPSYVFTTNESGRLSSTLPFTSPDPPNVTAGSDQTVTFDTLSDTTHTGHTITVTDAAGNASNLTIPDFVIDTTAPAISSVNLGIIADSTAHYNTDAPPININVIFDEVVQLTNTNSLPTLTLSNGGVATYSTGSGSATLTFQYSVTNASTETTDLEVSEYTANGGIQDLAGNAFSGTISGNNGGTVVIDTTAPTMTITNTTNGVLSGSSTSVSNNVFKFEANETTDGDFASGDVNIEESDGNGGWQSSSYTSANVGFVSSNNKTYTVTLAGINSGTYRLSVAANTFTDESGNNNTASNYFEITYV